MKNALYALLLFLFILCGCSHKENYSIIKGIGFENKDHELFLPASCAKIEEQEVKTYHTKGNSTAELLDHLYSQSADTPYFEQNELIVISKNLGKDDIKRILHGYFSRDKRKGSEYIVCSETEPSELFDAYSAEEIIQVLETAKVNASALPCTISSFIAASEGTGSSVLIPMINIEDETLSVQGAALFVDYAFTDTISPDLLTSALFVLGDAENTVISLKTENENLCLKTDKQKIAFKTEIGEFGLHFIMKTDISLSLTGRSDITGRNIDADAVNQIAEKMIKRKMEQIMRFAVQKRCDFLNLAARSINTDEKLSKAYHQNWAAALANASFEIEVHCNTKISGVITQPEEPEE